MVTLQFIAFMDENKQNQIPDFSRIVSKREVPVCAHFKIHTASWNRHLPVWVLFFFTRRDGGFFGGHPKESPIQHPTHRIHVQKM